MSAREKDFAALVLRAAVGPMLIAHGTNKVFGSGGLEGTTGWFDSLGLQPAAVHARMAAATEIGAGTLITLGAGNPLPSAAVVGLMATAAATDHRGKGFFVFKGGWEYTAIVAAAATALAGLGQRQMVGRSPPGPEAPVRRGFGARSRHPRRRRGGGPARSHVPPEQQGVRAGRGASDTPPADGEEA